MSDNDKKIVYEIATTSSKWVTFNAHEIGCVDIFGETAGILNTLNYGTVIKRLRKALNELYFENRCDRFKHGRGNVYDFSKSLGKEY